MKRIVAPLFLLVSISASADFGGSASIGAGLADRESVGVPPFDLFKLHFENGRTRNFDIELHESSAWMARGRYSTASYKLVGSGGLTVDDNVVQRESQVALFVLIPGPGGFVYRLGGGYEHIRDDFPDAVTRGPLLEAGAFVRPLPILTLDVGAAWMPVERDESDDHIDRLELQLVGIVDLGLATLSLRARSFMNQGERTYDDQATELALLVGARWGHRLVSAR